MTTHKSKRYRSVKPSSAMGKSSQKSNRWPRIGLGAFAIILIFSVLYGTSSQLDAKQEKRLAVHRTIGGVTQCQQNPEFSKTLGFKSIAIDTSRNRGKGLVLFDFAASNTYDKENIYQHKTWDDAGDIGSYTIDGTGNIYVAPFPHIDLFENRPEAQNTIHRIDTESSMMAPFTELPAARPLSTQSPFGVVALTYDCETASLYAASLAGSTRQEEVGRIYQIDVTTGEIMALLEGIDAYGLGIFNSVNDKRLYFGRARSSDVYSIGLDENGAFHEQPRREFSLSDLYHSDKLVARRITFRDARLKVDAFKFHYNLTPMAEQGPRPSFKFIYDESDDAWQFAEMVRDDL